jgi:hypothetical protein
MRKRCAKKNR